MRLLYDIGYALSRFVAVALMGAKTEGRENIPRDGAFILAPNHISNLDPPLIGSFSGRRLNFFAKSELFDVPVLGFIVRHVNAHPVKRGAFDRKAVTTAVEILKSGKPLVVFPEGTRSFSDSFLEPKAGIGMIARAALAPIVPCYVEGSNHFKRCLTRRERLQIRYGAPITVDWIRACDDSREGWMEIAREVMRRIGLLKAGLRKSMGESLSENTNENEKKNEVTI